MSVVVVRGSKDTVRSVPARVAVAEPEGANQKVAGLIADVEVKHALRIKERTDFQVERERQRERRRVELEAKKRRRQRAVYD